MKKIEDLKLPKAFKRKWVAALRSGEFKQGYGYLYDKEENAYCCLGVACVVEGFEPKQLNFVPVIHNTKKYASLPRVIKGDIDRNKIVNKLSEMNDGWAGRRKSFKTIANWIEKNL